MRCFIKALKVNPKNVEARFYKGMAEFSLKDYCNTIKVRFASL